ncbi:MAG: hypothetical protein M4579_004444 [Chaenotheca gracillima]|nr:MAG: hypothetical protein M4579_004444 [Chaenotheca gracillima]
MSDPEQMEGALPPPPGVTPNFAGPVSINAYNVATQGLVLGITSSCVLMRLYTKYFIKHAFGSEDWASMVAWFGAITYSSIALTLGEWGAGVHQWDVPITKITRFAQLVYVDQILYGIVVFVTKVSILLLFLRIFGPKQILIWSTWILIGVMAAYYLAATLAKVLICTPIKKQWEPEVPGFCLNTNAIFLTDCIFSIVSDFYILITPMPLIWNLRMPVRRRLGVMSVFAMGIFACLASILRTYYTLRPSNELDTTYRLIPIMLWSLAEINLGIISSCLPILPSLFRHYFARDSTKTANSQSIQLDTTASSTSRKARTIRTRQLEADETGLIGYPHSMKLENSIEGGNSNHDSDELDGSWSVGGSNGGIMRTVEVEQSFPRGDSRGAATQSNEPGAAF